MKRDNIKAIYTLSPIQEGMLYHRLYDAKDTSYHIQNAFWVQDAIDIQLIKSSLSLLAQKHEVLKTSFIIPQATGRPWQVILNNKEIEFVHEKCSKEKEKYIGVLKEQDLARGFDLQKDSLLRLHLISFSEKEHYFLFSYSHIIMDGWCMSLLFGDFLRYYEALNSGKEFGELQELIQEEKNGSDEYKDYIDWLKLQDMDEGLKYWERLLKDYDGNAEIKPFTEPFENVSHVMQKELVLSKELTQKLNELAIGQQVTINTISEAMIGVLLQRYCFLDDVVYGKVVSGRNAKLKGIDRIVGLFINTIPARVKCEKDTTVAQLLDAVQRDGIESNHYDYCDLSSIQSLTNQGSKLIHVIFAFENYFFDQENMKVGEHGLHYSMESEREETNYDITISAHIANGQLVFHLLYESGKYVKEDIQRILGHMEKLLTEMVCSPDKLISELEIATDSEKMQIENVFNDTKRAYPNEETVVSLLESQAEKMPDKVAVVFEDTKLTYRELNEKSNGLAYKLRTMGIVPGDFVGILAKRSVEVVIGICAILKAGGAYLPLDDAYPDERKSIILADCNAKVLLNYHGQVPAGLNIPVISLENESCFAGHIQNLPLCNSANDLAYCIYTSGTTGKVKGVLIEHKNIIKLVKNQDYTVLDENTVILQTGQLAFDASTFEIWGSLLNGGQVHLIREETLLDIAKFKTYLVEQKINTLFMTTALFNQLITEDVTFFDTLEHFMFGGEKTSEKCVELLMKRYTVPDVRNVYGPTETTTFATHYIITDTNRKKTPIGRPISNTQAYVLNGSSLCGIGVPGELCIAGEGVARGYLNRPELTKERFTDNVFGEGKLYHSGDLVRWLPDGNIEFIGRIDEQVKIRGFRIELGEISEAIRKLDFVRESVAIVNEDEHGEKYISAYLVGNEKINLSKVRTQLRTILPDYMIPAFMMQIDEIPMNRNGKVDKHALPKIENVSQKTYQAPQSEEEKTICKIFSELLGVETVGVKDNFYELGGDSIKAIRIVSKIRGEGFEIGIKDIMDSPSIEITAKRIHKVQNSENQLEVTGEVKITPIIERFLSWKLANPDNFNQDILICIEKDYVPYVKDALEALAVHHDMLRAVYCNDKLEILSVKDSPLCEHREINLRDSADYPCELEEECSAIQASMKLSQPPLLRSALFHTREKEYLFICIHHIAVDGVSFRILLEDFYTAVRQLAEGKKVMLPAKTVSYQEWAKAMYRYRERNEITKESIYWKNVAGDIQKYGRLRIDSREKGYRCIEIQLSRNETADLLQKAGKAFHTEINDILLGALGMAVRKWTGQSKLAIGLEGHGRDKYIADFNIDRTVGWFTSIYPVIIECHDDIRTGLIKNKENLRKVPHHGIGYSIYKDKQENDTPDMCFNYLGQMDAENTDNEMKFCSTGKSSIEDEFHFNGISINSMVLSMELNINITYQREKCDDENAQKLAAYYKESLKSYIRYCVQQKQVIYTPSDYLLPDFSMEDIEKVKEIYPEATDMYPLTPLQEGMLYHNLAEPDSTAYIIQHVISLDGKADDITAKAALNMLADRHEVFRTAICHEGLPRAVQVILADKLPEFEFIDLTGLSEEEKVIRFAKIQKQDVERGFQLDRDPLIRLKLVSFSEEKSKMLWSYHHIIIDGWCLSYVYGDYIKYFDFINKGKSEKEILELVQKERKNATRYRDYIKWLTEADYESGLTYWDEVLMDYDTIAKIQPMSKPEITKEQMRQYELTLTREESEQVLQLANEKSVSVNIIAEAAWGITLQKYSGSKDVVFGKVVSGRNADIPGIDETVGFFINTVLDRVKTKPGMKLGELLEELKQNSIKSEQYSYCSLAEIQNRTSLKADLIQSLFVFENYFLDEDKLKQNDGNLKMYMEAGREQTDYPISVVMSVSEGRFNIGMMYQPNKYCENDVVGILNCVAEVIREMIKKPDVEVDRIEAISESEKEQVMNIFNQTEVPYPREKTITDLFYEQVQLHRDKTALVFRDKQLTYGELDRRSNKVAARLRSQGIKPNNLVMLIAERGIEMIAGILGIMKAGGAFLPVDVTLPLERIRYMVKDSGVREIITYQKNFENQDNQDLTIISLDDLDTWQELEEELTQVNRSSDLAYCIYTSGTTGEPKGVLIEHYGVVNLREYFIRVHGVKEQDRVLQYANYAFDAFISELTLGILTGASLYILEETVQKDFLLFEDYMKRMHITLAILPPQYLNQVSLLGSDVRTIITAGSETSASIVNNNRFIPVYSNDYGPTEGTVCSTYWKHSSSDQVPDRIPIGKPMTNKKIYILNGEALCGIGIPGELCVAGEGLARGYLNRPDLTASKFRDNPFGAGRLYRTGDLVRWLPDGNIDFLGRTDEQVKIRGYRIELNEIAEQIRKIDGVKETAVIVKEQNGEKAICAYIAAEIDMDFTLLREELGKTLPEYMIPGYMKQIDTIPMNRNGKLDKRALPSIEFKKANSYAKPEKDEEKVLCGVYEEVLGVEEVGLTDRFFELGGDSIKAIRIVSKMRVKGYELAIRDIMNYPTVELTAKCIKKSSLNEKMNAEVTGEVRKTPIIRRFEEWNLKYPERFSQDVLIKIIPEQVEYVEIALQALAKNHDMLRAGYEDGKLRILSSQESPLCEYKEISISLTENKDQIIAEESTKVQKSLSLAHGPWMKSVLFHTQEGNYLFICIHHLAVDGVSWRILLEDLKVALKQLEEGRKVSLPSKTASYQEWAELLYEYGRNQNFQKEAHYWEKVKADIDKYGKIPGNGDGEEFAETSITFDREITFNLLYRSGKAFRTEINDILLSALGMAVKKWTGQDKVAIGLEGHGREKLHKNIEIDRTVGWFTSIFPFVIECYEDIKESVIRNKENLRKVPLHGIGYGLLTEGKAGVEPEICFNYLGEMDAETNEDDMKFCSTVESSNEENQQTKGIAINSMVVDKRLIVSFACSRGKCSKERMKQLIKLYEECLKEVIAFCAVQEKQKKTPSDYLLPELRMEDIELIEEMFPETEDIYPLTPLQEGMLYHNIADKKSTAYFIQHVISLEGKVNREQMQDALEVLAHKHKVFQTAVLYEKLLKPVQIIRKNRVPESEMTDLSLFTKEEKEIQFEKIKKDDLVRGFDLEKDTLVRVKLVRFSDDAYKMLWSYHHIIMDGWCVSYVYGDYIKYFDLLRSGRSKEELIKEADAENGKHAQYRDYVKWLLEADNGLAMKYWEEQLFGYEDIAEIKPMSKPEKDSEQMKLLQTSLTRTESSRLLSMAKDENVSVNTVAEAAWGITLQKYCHSRDVVFGKVVSGRNANIDGIEEMTGLFINTVPVRVIIKKGQTKSQFLKSLQEDGIRANQYDYCSLAEIQSKTSQKQDLIKNIFIFENYYMDEGRLVSKNQSLQLKMEAGREQTNYPMSVIVSVDNDIMKLRIMYEPDVYPECEIQGILERYKQVLNQLASYNETLIEDIDTLTSKERTLVVEKFNQTQRVYPRDSTMIEIFERMAAEYPDKEAVVFCGKSLTYNELNLRSNQMANCLRKNGVKPDDCVMIIAKRSLEMVIGILGILKAGGAYLPVDVSLPDDRIRYMIENSRAKIVLIYKKKIEDIGAQIIDLEEPTLWEEPDDNLKRVNVPKNLAYCIYTSGTTGQPKGVMIEHRNLIKLVVNADYVTFNEKTVLLQTAQLAFDASAFEIWGPILNGGTVHIIPDIMLLDCNLFKNYIVGQQINTLFMTTALFNQMVNYDESIFDSLKYLMFGGEKASEKQVETILNRNKDLELINLYGPTEGTTLTTFYPIKQNNHMLKIPIGKPISNTQVYVMEDGKLCGVGIPGELCIAGEGVARGYINSSEMTAEKFTENPFGTGKLYHSGDLVRWMADGNIDFLGRLDEQVKVRGFRIELGEITNALESLEQVKRAVVIVKKDFIGEEAICAYVESEQEISVYAIKDEISRYLPEYMIPSYIMQVNQIPVTSNGKVNKKQLPEPDALHAVRKKMDYLAAENEYEEVLLMIWSNILRTDQIGTNDNFFEIGGTSLLLITMQSQINEKYPDCIEVGDIFANPTIKLLAEFIEQKREGTIQCEKIIFPDKFFATSRKLQSKKAVEKITGRAYERMRELYNSDKEEFHGMVMLMYVYSLSQMTKQEIIPVIEANGKHYVSYPCSMSDVNDLNICKNNIKEKWQMAKKFTRIPLKVKDKQHGVLPVFLFEFHENDRYREWADFSMSFDWEEDSAVMTIQLFHNKLVADQIFELLQIVIHMLNAIFCN